jgi:hypothetical protein
MHDELGRVSKEAVVVKLRYYPGISLEEVNKTKKNVSTVLFNA